MFFNPPRKLRVAYSKSSNHREKKNKHLRLKIYVNFYCHFPTDHNFSWAYCTFLKQNRKKEQIQVQGRNDGLFSMMFFIWKNILFWETHLCLFLKKWHYWHFFWYWTWIRTKNRTLFLRVYIFFLYQFFFFSA
jgi:hypothetical protein